MPWSFDPFRFVSSLVRHRAPSLSASIQRFTCTALIWTLVASLSPLEAQIAPLKAKLISMDAPSVLLPGELYDVEVTLRNDGSATWTTTDFVLGTVTSTLCFGPNHRHPVPSDVAPGEEVTFQFQIQGPVVAGSCTAIPEKIQWKMLRLSLPWFGEPTDEIDIEVRDLSHKVTIETVLDGQGEPTDARFVAGGVEHVVTGFNYFPYYEEEDPAQDVPEQDRAWLVYDAERAEGDFRQMARLGVNTVRMWAPGGIAEPQLGVLDQAICDKLDHAIDTARHNGIRTVLSLGNPNYYKERITTDFCPTDPTFCAQNGEGLRENLLYNASLRDFVVDRHLHLLEECDLFGRPEIFSFDIWQEPGTGADVRREEPAAVLAWENHVVSRFGGLPEAFDRWGYSPAATCGPDNDKTHLCPPDRDELCCEPAEALICCSPGNTNPCCFDCGGASAAPAGNHLLVNWTAMSHDYRRFVDQRYQETLSAAVARIEAREALLAPGLPTLKTSGFSSFFVASPDGQRGDCRSNGYRMNPRIANRVFDYASVHVYPWSGQNQTFDDSSGDSLERYHRLRFLLDYIRRGQDADDNPVVLPVVLEETGYDVCLEDQENGIPVTCNNRQIVQDDVFGRVAVALAETQANGGLYWTYRDRVTNWRWGTLALDDTPNIVVPQLPANFQVIDLGRDAPLTPLGNPVVADPFAEVDLYGSLLQSVESYKTEGDAGGGLHGPVVVEVTEEPGSSDP